MQQLTVAVLVAAAVIQTLGRRHDTTGPDPAEYRASVLQDVPTVYWPLIGDGKDEVGSNDLIFPEPPGVPPTVIRHSRYERNLLFWQPEGKHSGVKPYAKLPHSPAVNPPDGTSMTVEFWAFIRDDTHLDRQQRCPLSSRGSRGTNHTGFSFFVTNGRWEFWMGGAGGWQVAASSYQATLFEWTHIVGTWTSTDKTMRLYTNGVLQASRAETTHLRNVDANLYLGALDETASYAFPGILSDVALYSQALPWTRVSIHYSAGSHLRSMVLDSPDVWYPLQSPSQASQPDVMSPVDLTLFNYPEIVTSTKRRSGSTRNLRFSSARRNGAETPNTDAHSPGTAFTITLWYYLDATTDTHQCAVGNRGSREDVLNPSGYALCVVPNNHPDERTRGLWGLWLGASLAGGPVAAGGKAIVGQWTKLIVIVDYARAAHVYQPDDGPLLVDAPEDVGQRFVTYNANTDSAAKFTIGALQDSEFTFNGMIADVAVYDYPFSDALVEREGRGTRVAQAARPSPPVTLHGAGLACLHSTDEVLKVLLEGIGNHGVVWGTMTAYTTNSNVAAAAVHAGLLRVGEKKLLGVRCIGLRTNFTGSNANGVASLDWPATTQAFAFVNDTPQKVPVSPQGAYHRADTRVSPTVIHLEDHNLNVGDTVQIAIAAPKTFAFLGTPDATVMLGVFTNTTDMHPTIGLATGLPQFDTTLQCTACDVLNDFVIASVPRAKHVPQPDRYAVTTTIPADAKHLLVALFDDTYSDNPATAGDLAVVLSPVASPTPTTKSEEVCNDWFCAMARCVVRGQQFDLVVKGQTSTSERGIWGTGVYADDSDIRVAAVHSGVLQPGETATLTVLCYGARENYDGTTANGVASRSFGHWPQSWALAKKE